jgi:hypothetical protein
MSNNLIYKQQTMHFQKILVCKSPFRGPLLPLLAHGLWAHTLCVIICSRYFDVASSNQESDVIKHPDFEDLAFEYYDTYTGKKNTHKYKKNPQ